MNYKIIKVLNNSSLLVEDAGRECILIGKGIGFKRKSLEYFPKDEVIEKQYYLFEETQNEGYPNTSQAIIKKTAYILRLITKEIDVEISDSASYALSNHLISMFIRIENEEIFKNPFHYETITLYKNSYDKAKKIGNLYEVKMDEKLPDSEIDFLTLYLHSLSHPEEANEANLLNAILSEINDSLEIEGIHLDKQSLDYARFITHIKFVVKRFVQKSKLKESPVLEGISEQYPKYKELTRLVSNVIEKQLNTKLSKSEETYILLHIARLSLSITN